MDVGRGRAERELSRDPEDEAAVQAAWTSALREGRASAEALRLADHVGDHDATRFCRERGIELGWEGPVDDDALALLAGLPVRRVAHWLKGVTSAGIARLVDLPALAELNLNDLEVSDADLERLGRCPALRSLRLRRSPVTSAGLRHLGDLRLEVLDLTGTNVDDGVAATLERWERLRQLTLIHTRVGDAGLAGLQGSTQLTHLRLERSQVRGPGLRHLAGHTGLSTLGLGELPFDDAHVAPLAALRAVRVFEASGSRLTRDVGPHLAGWSELDILQLARTQVDGAALVALSTRKLGLLDLRATPTGDVDLLLLGEQPQLYALTLAETQVSDEGLAHLAGFATLGVLDLSLTQVSDAGLAHLRALPELSDLKLEGTAITDAGLATLAGLSSLTDLDLRGTQISDAGLAQLDALPALRTVYAHGTAVTPAGAAASQAHVSL